MDARLSNTQMELATAVRQRIEAHSIEWARLWAEGEIPVHPAWEALSDLGAFGLCAPERSGGVGMSLVDVAAVLIEFGRSLVPGYITNTMLAPLVVAGASSGSEVVEGLLTEVAAGRAAASVWDLSSEAWSGTAGLSPELGATLDGRLLSAQTSPRGAYALIAGVGPLSDRVAAVRLPQPGIKVEHAPSLSLVDYLSDVHLSSVQIDSSSLITNPQAAEVLRVARCLEMVGSGERLLDMAAEYARTRQAFGKPIGAFQAVQHLLCDALVRVENARALSLYAASAASEGGDGISVVGRTAELYCASELVAVATSCMQVYGGIGYTWELGLHLFLRRLKQFQAELNRPAASNEIGAFLRSMAS